MPFKTYNELMDMTKKDPKMAMMMVNKAKSSGQKVVDEGNPGYSARGNESSTPNPRVDAVKRRMQKMTPSQPEDQTQEVVNRRKSMGF